MSGKREREISVAVIRRCIGKRDPDCNTLSTPPPPLQIAKDMQRWAKTVNAAKAAQQQQLQTVIQQEKAESVMVAAQPTPVAGGSPAVVKRTGIALSAAFEVCQRVGPLKGCVHKAVLDVIVPVITH